MAKLISDQIAGKASTLPPASTTRTPAKLSRKERMKQELKQQLSGDLETVFQDIESARDKTASRLQVKSSPSFKCLRIF